MNFHGTSQPYMRPVVQIGIGHRSLPRVRNSFPTSIAFWRPVCKIILPLLPLVLAINMYVSYSVGKTMESIVAADNKRHGLMDKNIELRAMKARLRGDEEFRRLAAEKLSLYEHTKGQVGTFNQRKGYFIYL